jgi:hypothetical protein
LGLVSGSGLWLDAFFFSIIRRCLEALFFFARSEPGRLTRLDRLLAPPMYGSMCTVETQPCWINVFLSLANPP